MTSGQLDLAAKLRFARAAVFAQLSGLPDLIRARLTAGPGTAALLTDREPPDTALTREVLELARSSYQKPLLGHCLRTWLWADLLGGRDGIKPDQELLYVACLLHDIALTDRHRPPPEAACFAVHGGEVARTTLAELGAEPSYADEVAQAIALHMNIHLPTDQGLEAHLLHAGAHLDVAGTRAGELPRQAIRDVVSMHPRAGFPDCFATLMLRESAERPNSRAALLWRLGMRLPLNHNPLDR
ncbi:HD domain-containing protein [Kribbella steppae]|uniref:HD domain-containing protein n=1 Tax=Kribbella steppae TaxID=2512223 RepID=A0A4R2HQ68_9ACTN|nr:HD domain-containing protein [Kribbella steppae]TCO33334.1 HD domain-containing protein [Kribbella steppae]